jgi:hypothetical protein
MDNTSEEPFPGTPLGDGYYLVSEEELRDATIIRPGIPEPDDADMFEVPTELMTPTTELRPVDIVLFYDKHSSNPVDNGLNQWAFVVDFKRALYVRGVVHSIALANVRKLPNAVVVRRFPPPMAPTLLKCFSDAAGVRCGFRWQ